MPGKQGTPVSIADAAVTEIISVAQLRAISREKARPHHRPHGKPAETALSPTDWRDEWIYFPNSILIVHGNERHDVILIDRSLLILSAIFNNGSKSKMLHCESPGKAQGGCR